MTDASHRPADARTGLRLPPLYPIIDLDLCRMRGIDPLTLAQACLDGGANILQVRQKAGEGGSGLFLATVMAITTLSSDARVIVNDRADIAAMAGAAGVHVGQQDLPPDAVRAIVGMRGIIGVSTHTPEQADAAAASVADYVAVGPVFRTATKDTGYEPRGLDLVRHAASLGKPVVAIGGVTLANAATVLAAGAAAVAVISDLLSGGDPARRVRDFLAIERH